MNPLNVKSSYYEVMRHYLVIDGKSTKDFGVYLSGDGTFKAPEKNVEEFTIPGRNGTFHYSVPDTYKNVKVPYDCFIFKDFKRNVAAFRSFLLSRKGYVRIEDTHHPDEFRMGMFHEEFDPEVFVDLTAAQFTINFDCRPERWLKSGEEKIVITEDATKIFNDTNFTAKPLIRVIGTNTGNAMLNITNGGVSTTISFVIPEEKEIYLDSENQEAYTYTKNETTGVYEIRSLNSSVYYSAGNTDRVFPDLKPGTNVVLMYPKDGSLTFQITPRWWIL